MTLLALTFLAALGSGLIAGFFLAFSACVMAALGRIPPASGISAMQSVNVVVLNPVFLGIFFGTAALSLVLAVASLMNWAEPAAFYLLVGSLLYEQMKAAGCASLVVRDGERRGSGSASKWPKSRHNTVPRRRRGDEGPSRVLRENVTSKGVSSTDLDLVPEADAVRDMAHRGTRRLVDPGGALVTLALDRHIVELNAMRTSVVESVFGAFWPLHARDGNREVVIAALFDDIVALGDDAVLQRSPSCEPSYCPQDTLVQRTPLVLVDVILPVARSTSQARRTRSTIPCSRGPSPRR